MDLRDDYKEFDKNSLTQCLIMVVEDDMTTASILTHLLSKEGYRVVCTDSGEDAIEAVQNLRCQKYSTKQ